MSIFSSSPTATKVAQVETNWLVEFQEGKAIVLGNHYFFILTSIGYQLIAKVDD
jgi:hypothetical protein